MPVSTKCGFGVFVIIAVELSQITPPVGFNLFVINGLTGDSMSQIAKMTFPFLLVMVAMIFMAGAVSRDLPLAAERAVRRLNRRHCRTNSVLQTWTHSLRG